MKELLVKNGTVFDPINKIDGVKMDIAVKGGKIVDKVGKKSRVIDAGGMIVLPGGVDIHSHIAGSKTNLGRMLRPEDHEDDYEHRTAITRAGVGYSVPSTFTTGYRYARLGYTTVFEPATPPMKTKHTHEELNDTPMLDKGCFPVFGNNWLVMEYLRDGLIEECAAYLAWMMRATKGYAIKIVNPGGVEAWHWGGNVAGLDDEVPHFGVTPREIVRGLCRVNTMLGLPHTIHVHTNNLGKPGNYSTTIETMKCVEDLATGSGPIMHVTHVQFSGFKGNSWINVSSGAPEIADYINRHRHITFDPGQIVFTNTTTMTGDGPFEYVLSTLSGNKWINGDVEAETGAGIVPFTYRRGNYVNATQWGTALELMLLVKDPFKICFTTDHPNGAPFTCYPHVITWLMSKRARDEMLARINRNARRRLDLAGIEREYSFQEIATITRGSTAKALSLADKGHLGGGADADISIYDIDPSKIDPSKDHHTVWKRLARAKFTIKGGEIVVKDGDIVQAVNGATYWVNPIVSNDLMSKVEEDLRQKFSDYYTIQMENYPVDERYLIESKEVRTEAEV